MQNLHDTKTPSALGRQMLGLFALALLTAAWAAPRSEVSRSGSRGLEAGEVLGPVSCAECHVNEFKVWKASPHESASKSLTRSKEAKRIAKSLGVRRIKSEERCVSCHYTTVPHGKKVKAVAGVSCESCHGPASGWVDLHQNFGAKGTTIEEESVEHREERSTGCDDVGMVRPVRVHRMAARCFTCHVIDDEELVDVGGHPTAENFELVAWSQGEMRHNFVRGEGKVNAGASVARRRMMFIAGRMLDLKYSLLALSAAKGGGEFEAMTIRRVERSIAGLLAIQERVEIPEVDAVLDKCQNLTVTAGLTIDEAIQRIDHCSAKLEARTDGSDFAGIDDLLPAPESYVGVSKD